MKTCKKDLLIGALIAVIPVLGLYLWDKYVKTDRDERLLQEIKNTQQYVENQKLSPVVVYKTKDSIVHAQKLDIPTHSIEVAVSKGYRSYVQDTLIKALNVSVDKITELTQIKARLEGELKATKQELASNKAKVTRYKDKYLEATTIEDSAGSTLKYAYNAKLDVVQYEDRKNWFSQKKSYIDISSPDKNFKVNDMERYKKEIKIPNKRFGVGVNIGYGAYLQNKQVYLGPYMGVGIHYNLFKF